MKSKNFIIALLSLLIAGCSDGIRELGADYFLSIEGESANAIFNRVNSAKGVPPSVLRYAYNSEFIVAEQRPDNNNNVMYDKIDYENGRQTIYYWIIIKKSEVVLGPWIRASLTGCENVIKFLIA